MKLAAFLGMARRPQSKDAAQFELLYGSAALLLFLLFISVGIHAAIQILIFGLITLALVVLATLLFLKAIKYEQPSPTFKTFTYNPYHNGEPIRKPKPSELVGKVNEASHIPEPTPSARNLTNVQRATELTISEKLRKIDWFQFEKLIELIYQQRGFKVKRLGGAQPDGGVDLIVEAPAATFVVQCKHWRKWNVGVRQIREFLGTLTDTNIQKGIFITLVGYSGEAKQLAEKHGIQILNESDLIKMLDDSGLRYSEDISRLFSDDRKYCPKCESELVVRANRQNGNKFWGCSTYPRCNFKMKLEA